jgi:hypothetical protein
VSVGTPDRGEGDIREETGRRSPTATDLSENARRCCGLRRAIPRSGGVAGERKERGEARGSGL